MKQYELGQKVLAVSAFKHHKGDITAAKAEFIARCQELDISIPKDPNKFIKDWAAVWDQEGNLDGHAHNSGRKRKLPKDQTQQLLDAIKDWAGAGLDGPFHSILHLKQHSPTTRAILEAAEAHASTVIRALKKLEPKLRFKNLRIKQKLTQKQKEDRLRVAQHHSQVSDSTLECVIWVDAKVMNMTISSVRGWVVQGEELPYETTRPASKKNPIVLKYYIGVCARTGAVFLRFYTGTTGMAADRDPSRPYLVSSDYVVLRRLLVYSSSQHLLNFLAPASAASNWITWCEPQHRHMLIYSTIC
jgi:hypothetical protein